MVNFCLKSVLLKILLFFLFFIMIFVCGGGGGNDEFVLLVLNEIFCDIDQFEFEFEFEVFIDNVFFVEILMLIDIFGFK